MVKKYYKIIKNLGQNYNQKTIYQTAKAVFEEKFITLNAYIGKKERLKIDLSINKSS